MTARENLLLTTPAYIWGRVAPYRERAARYEGGAVDLSIGSPVDETPARVREALAAGANAPGYPTAAGTPELRRAIVDWFRRRRGVPGLDEDQVVPTNGSKEFICLLPFWLGLGPGDVVVQPYVHYPTYSDGAAFVGASVVSEDDPAKWPEGASLIWLNSPGNPDGAVNDVDRLRAAVARAREMGAVIVQDECYAELGWSERWQGAATPCILDPKVVGDDANGVLACYSLSKQSNLAGYRAAFAAGDRRLVAGLVNVRKTAGLSLSAPIMAAMTAALSAASDGDVVAQRERYRRRRERLLPAVEAWGLRVDGSDAGLYLWATAGESCWTTLGRLADAGVLAAPGEFYGPGGADRVRISLTATDEAIDEAVRRLGA